MIATIHRTATGRVVYNRRPHLFRYRDVMRIAKAVSPLPEDIPYILLTLQRCYQDLAAAGADAVAIARGFVKLPQLAEVEIALQALAFLLGFVADWSESVVEAFLSKGYSLFKQLLVLIGGLFITKGTPSIEEVS